MALNKLTKVHSTGVGDNISLDAHAIDANAIDVVGIVTATEFHKQDGSIVGGAAAPGISTSLAIAYSTAL